MMMWEEMIEVDQRQIQEQRQRAEHPAWRGNKQCAMADLEAHCDSCIVARDSRGGAKQFASIPSNFFLPDLVRATSPSNRCFYECLYQV
jgi:hypothetical protein